MDRAARARRALALAAACTTALASLPVDAAPRLITDSRLRHLTGRPSVGRGYSLQSNALQSLCFGKVAVRDATFDFSYDIDEVEEDTLQGFFAPGAGGVRGGLLAAFLRERIEEAAEEERARGVKLRQLLATVTVDAYDHSLDEADSPLDRSAKKLLEDGRYATFFASCGFFYVRSLRTTSSYLALLQFEASSDASADASFMSLLEKGLLSFGDAAVDHRADIARLKAQAETRGLRLYVSALGLSKGDLVGLVPTSIDQFRTTIQAVAKLMQDPDSGVVTGLEVAPWLDHPDVGVVVAEKMGTASESFARTLRMEFNAQVVNYVAEHRAFLLDQYYRARLCREHLDVHYALGAGLRARDGVALDPDRTRFYNQSAENDLRLAITLRQFRDHFAAHPPEGLLDEANQFLRGRNGAPGAQACLDRLFEQGLDEVDAASIPACAAALRRTPAPYRFLDDYCLPKPLVIQHDVPKPLAR